MTTGNIKLFKGIIFCFFLNTFSLPAFCKYVSQYINIDYSIKKWELSQDEKDLIWYAYVKLSEGNWIHYSFTDSSEENQADIQKKSKYLCATLNNFLTDKGIDSKKITMKFSPYASLVVYKESGKNISANEITLDSDKAQHFNFRNNDGAIFVTSAGNIVVFPRDAFSCAKDAHIKVMMHEMLSKSDFIKTGYTSTSNGKLLESRGMYYIDATVDEKKVKLRQGKSGEIRFKTDNFPTPLEASMFNTFYGEEKKGVINWESCAHEKTKIGLNSKVITEIEKTDESNNKEHSRSSKASISYVQLCEKILYIDNDSKELDDGSCKINKSKYKELVIKHGKLKTMSKGEVIDITSFSDYLVISKAEPENILLALNERQKKEFNNTPNIEYIENEYGMIEGVYVLTEYYEGEETAVLNVELLNNFPITLKISKLGHINCDRFKGSAKKTNVVVQLDDYDYEQIKVYAVFNDIKSVMNGYYRKEHKGMIKFDQLPEGKEVTYIAATFKGDQVKLAYISKKVQKDDHIKLSLKTYSKENYEKVLDDLIPN